MVVEGKLEVLWVVAHDLLGLRVEPLEDQHATDAEGGVLLDGLHQLGDVRRLLLEALEDGHRQALVEVLEADLLDVGPGHTRYSPTSAPQA